MSGPSDGPDRLAREREARVDALCDRFEAAWRAGGRPPIGDYLAEVDRQDRPALLRELLAVELAYRRRAGEAPGPEEYRDHLLGADGSTLLDLFEPAGERSLTDTEGGRPDAPAGVAPVPDDRPRYELLELHAQGGLGTVHRALDRELDREVALKRLHDRLADGRERRRRFEWEARITGRLQHPGIVPVYSLGRDADGRPFYAMRFIEGRSLKQAIADGVGATPAGLRELLGRFLDVCDAIAYAHSRGVIHRDLKPQNIMLGPFGETLVVDWGLAKLVRPGADEPGPGPSAVPLPAVDPLAETATGEVMGTPAYMSPEQAAGRPELVGTAADIYGLGATLFAILTGRLPVEARSPLEAMDRVRRGELLGPRAVAPGVPAALDAVCRKAMAHRPEDRYASATALADDLKRWLADEPVSAWREPRTTRALRWARRHQTPVATAAAALLVAVVLGSGAAVWYARRVAAERARLERAASGVRDQLDRARSSPADVAAWEAALATARQAEEAAGPSGDSGPARRIRALRVEIEAAARAAGRDRALLAELGDLRAARGDYGDLSLDRSYAAAFRRIGVDPDASTAGQIAAALGGRPAEVATALAGYLDDWAVARRHLPGDPDRWRRLVEASRALDPDPGRDRIRGALADDDPARRGDALRALAAEARDADWPVTTTLLLAEALRSAGALGETGDVLRRAVVRHPDDAWANYWFAQHLVQHDPGNREEALRYFTAARAQRPELAGALAKLLERHGRLDEAIALYRDVIRRRPDSAEHQINLAVLLKRTGRAAEAGALLRRAIDGLRAALREAPGWYDLHYSLGLALQTSGASAAAVDAYRAALRLNPADDRSHYNLGNALTALGRREEAVAAYRAAIVANPSKTIAWHNLARTLAELGRRDEAVEAFRAALAIDPRKAESSHGLARVLRELGRHDKAAEACRAALAHDPRHFGLQTNLGLALTALGRREEAVEAYRAAIEADPGQTSARHNLGLVLTSLGRREEAVEVYRALLALDPRRPTSSQNLAFVLRELGRHGEAADVCRAGLAHDPNNFGLRSHLARALVALGRWEEAAGACRAALEIDPEAAEIHIHHGLALQRLGRYEDGLAALERGHRLGSGRPGWAHDSAGMVERSRRLLELDRALPAILRGEVDPGADRLLLGDVCRAKGLYTASVRFAREAFAADPGRADDLDAGHRRDAARGVALAADGRGRDAPPPGDALRGELRRQALDWLGADLDGWARRIESDPGARASMAEALRAWRADPDLASLRDEPSLAALPEADRAACRALWSRVDALLARAEGGPAPGPGPGQSRITTPVRSR